jgi:hypothetical protein
LLLAASRKSLGPESSLSVGPVSECMLVDICYWLVSELPIFVRRAGQRSRMARQLLLSVRWPDQILQLSDTDLVWWIL